MLLPALLLQVAALVIKALASAQPVVHLPYGSFVGITDNDTTQFLGIPFAQPPLGDLRFQLPQPPAPLRGLQPATAYGAACFQQLETFPPGFSFEGNYANISEDCLTINIIKPATHDGAPLPVIFWIHGGGFEIGDATDTPMLPFVNRSMAIDRPVIAVTANYRLSALGFLAGEQVEREGLGNLGLHDQRFALQWIQQHIHKFGGDPRKVVIAGVSAGAISTAMQLVANDGEFQSLFRGAFMESGSAVTMPSVASGQDSFNQIASFSNCTDTPDPLQCLRQLPFDTLAQAINQTRNLFSFSSLDNEWRPRVDGRTWRQDSLCAISQGLYVKVPIIAGNCDDEGTIFSLVSVNVTTDAEFSEYIRSNYFREVTDDEMTQVENAYPEDPALGSPFDTGNNNTLTPEYKRIAAIQGDIVFQGPRRHLLNHASTTQNAWAYLSKRGKSNQIIGASHASDTSRWYARNTTDFLASDFLINFINYLNPNGISDYSNANSTDGKALYWPTWNNSSGSPSMLTFFDNTSAQLSPDTYRADSMSLLNRLQIADAQKTSLCSCGRRN